MNPVPLYLSPNYAKLASGYDQAEMAMLREFATKGYLVFDPEFDDFDSLAEQVKQDLDGKYNERQRVQDGWQQSEAVRRLATHPRILKVLELLHGRKPFPFQTLNFNVGTQQKTHSDTMHFDSLPRGFMAGVWVALEDVDAENGPLQYYPGSHQLHHFDLGELGARDVRNGNGPLYGLYDKVYEPAIEKLVEDQGFEPEFGHIRKGQALIWAANLLHGGAPILDPSRTRYSQVTHYFFDDCAYVTPLGTDLLAGYTYFRQPWDIATGRKRSGVYGSEPVSRGRVLFHKVKRRAQHLLGRVI